MCLSLFLPCCLSLTTVIFAGLVNRYWRTVALQHSTAMRAFFAHLILLALCDLSLATKTAKKAAERELSAEKKDAHANSLCALLHINPVTFQQSLWISSETEANLTAIHGSCLKVMRAAVNTKVPIADLIKITKLYAPKKLLIDKEIDIEDIEKVFTLLNKWGTDMITTFLYCTKNSTNRGELMIQAATFMPVDDWRTILASNFATKMILRTGLNLEKIIARPTYSHMFRAYMNMPSTYKYPCLYDYPYCTEPVLMAILDFCAKKESLCYEEERHLLFELGCHRCSRPKNSCYTYDIGKIAVRPETFYELLTDENFLERPPQIATAILTYRNLPQVLHTEAWPVRTITSVLSRCEDVDCVKYTLDTIALSGNEGVDVDVFRSVTRKAVQDNVKINDILTLIAKLYHDTFKVQVVKFFHDWSDAHVRFLFSIFEIIKTNGNPLESIREFIAFAVDNRWSEHSTMDFVYRSQKIDLLSTQYFVLIVLVGAKQDFNVMKVLEFLEASQWPDHGVWKRLWQKGLSPDLLGLVAMANRCCHIKAAVTHYLLNPNVRACSHATIERVGTQLTGVRNAEDYYKMFDRDCTT